MKRIICMLVLLAGSQLQAQTTWQLIWSDEFSGESLNTNNWAYAYGNGGWGNNEWQYYTNAAENIEVSNGALKITARHEGTGPTEYTSARIITKDRFEFQYGKVEARMKLPLGQGLWPAFWTLGANIDDVSWPRCGEIDIMEHVNNEYSTHGAVHWYNNGHSFTGQSTSVDPTEYHVYGVIWEANQIRWFVDGIQFYQFNIQASNQSDDAFMNPMYLLLNLAVGGNWPGYPDATTPFPSSMLVDYVRVYQPELANNVARVDENLLSVFPNPVADELRINAASNEIEQCRILDLSGKELLCVRNVLAPVIMNVGSLAPGCYIVECTGSGTCSRRTILKY
ncbi:MAG: family 16 glycosylhydrolase [Flavobacteriales bacterium]